MSEGATILVVEDNPTARKMLRVSLEAEGYRVIEAPDACTAIQMIGRSPDLVIQDLVLPDMNGIELNRRLRLEPGGAEVPIIALSGFMGRLEEASATQAAFNAYFVKPIEPSRLLDAVRSYLPAPSAPAHKRGRGRTLIAVDDDPVQLKLMRFRLEGEGFGVQPAADGIEALRLARKRPPDGILSDVLMPGMDGFELSLEVRRDPRLRLVPVVLVSSHYLEQADQSLAKDVGANRLLLRTEMSDEFILELIRALDEPRSPVPAAPVEFVRREHAVRAIRQLERQVQLNSGLAQRCAMYGSQLSLLATVTDALSGSADFASTLHRVLAACLDAAGISKGVLYLAGAGTGLAVHGAVGYPREAGERLADFFGQAHVLEHVIASETAIAIPSSAIADDVATWLLREAEVTSALIVPLRAGDVWVGALFLGSSQTSVSTPDNLMFALALGRQFGQAIALANSWQSLAASEQRFARVFRGAPAALAMASGTGRLLDLNDRCAEIFGYSHREVAEHAVEVDSWWADPRDGDYVMRTLREKGTLLDFECRLRRKSGELFDAVLSLETLDLHGQHSLLLMPVDVSERKRNERALLESEARFRLISEHIKEVFFINDPATFRTLYVSPAYEEIFGRSLESAYAKPGEWLEAVHPDDRERMRNSAQSSAESGDVFRILRPDGSVRWIRSRAFPAPSPSQTVVVGLAEDITELRRAEDRLQHAQKMEAIGRLAGGVAHDFNNLLTAILGYSHLALRNLKREDPLHEFVDEIQKAGNRAGSLTRQLLAFSRQQVLAPRVISVTALLRDLEKMLRRLLREDIDLRMMLESDDLCVRADPTQMDQVIVNLVVNARDAMPEGGVLTITSAIQHLAEPITERQGAVPAGTYVVVSVVDTGVGMDEDTRAHIFEPFFTTKDTGKGTGLGLATVHGIVQQSGGHVSVLTEPGLGSTFQIYLPMVDAPADHLAEGPAAEVPTGGETILLVEDEEAVRALARLALEQAGYRVHATANGGEALALCEAHAEPFHLLVTDVVMPGIGGPELAQRLVALCPGLPVLYMSGYTERGASWFIEAGATFLEKPFTPDSLARKVREVLDARADRGNGERARDVAA